MSITTKKTKAGRQKLDYDAITKQAIKKDKEAVVAATPPAPPPSPPLTPADHEAHARSIKELGAASAMFMAMQGLYGSRIDLQSYKILIDDFLREVGDPKDPVLRMLAEQMFLTHHATARLQARAAMMEGSKNLEVFLSGAARMMSEFRKHTALLSELRAKKPERKEATEPLPPRRSLQSGKKNPHGKLVSNRVARRRAHAA